MERVATPLKKMVKGWSDRLAPIALALSGMGEAIYSLDGESVKNYLERTDTSRCLLAMAETLNSIFEETHMMAENTDDLRIVADQGNNYGAYVLKNE